MRVRAITKIFPNAAEPLSAPFNRQQFAALAGHCQIVDVLATIPWYPGAGLLAKWSSAGRLATWNHSKSRLEGCSRAAALDEPRGGGQLTTPPPTSCATERNRDDGALL